MKQRGVQSYLAEYINFGGDIIPRGTAMQLMKSDGFTPREIDAYMMGAKTVNPASIDLMLMAYEGRTVTL